MPEQIDIAKLNFDTDGLDKALLETRKQIDELSQSVSDERKQIRESNKAVNKLTQANLDLAASGEKNSKEYKNNQAEIKKLKNTIDSETKAVIQNEKARKELKNEQKEIDKVINTVNNSRSESIDHIKKSEQVLGEEVNTIKQARDQNKELNTLRNNINANTEEGAEAIANLNQKLDKNNNFIDENADGLTQQNNNIGNYNGELSETNDQLGISNTFLGRNIQNFAEQQGAAQGGASAMGFFGNSLKPVIAGLRTMTTAALQFIATPIGAVLTILVVSFAAVQSAISRSEEATDKLTSAFSPFKGILNAVMDVLAAFGELIIDNIVKNLELLSTAFDVVVERMSIALSFLGLEDAAEGVDSWKKSIDEAAASGSEYEKTLQKITNQSRRNKILTSEDAVEIEKNKEAVDDLNLSTEERIAAGNKLQAAIERRRKREEALAQLEIKAAKQNIELIGETTEATDQLVDAQVKMNELEAANIGERSQERSKLQALENEQEKALEDASKAGAERHKKKLEEIIAERELALESFDLQNEGVQGSLKEEVDFYREKSAKKLSILKSQLAAEKLSQQEYNLEVRKLARDTQQKETEATAYYIEQRLAKERNALSQRIEDVNRLSDEEVQIRKSAQDRIYQDELVSLEKRRDAGLLSQREFNAQSEQLDLQFRERKDEIDLAYRQQKAEDEELRNILEQEKKIQDEENEFQRKMDRLDFEFDAEQEKLEQQKDEGLISEENYLSELELITKKHSKTIAQIERAQQNNKLELYSGVAGDVADILGEETAAGKFFASAQALMNTYVAATNALTAGPILGPILAGLITIKGLKNVKEINKTKTQMYTGGYTGDGGVFTRTGYTHAGEVVFNQEDVRSLGGAERVNNMRPTESGFGSMPTGVRNDDNDNDKWDRIGELLKNGVREGSEQGTNTGLVEHSENISVKQKAIF